uniref:Uncharacterized protein n=1 Tax=Anopheles atroparvus TaxID=41427 RepID=A0A182IWJ2_ANOAO
MSITTDIRLIQTRAFRSPIPPPPPSLEDDFDETPPPPSCINFFLNCGVLSECDGDERLPAARSDEFETEYESIWCGGGRAGEWCSADKASFSLLLTADTAAVEDEGEGTTTECGMLCELELSCSIR